MITLKYINNRGPIQTIQITMLILLFGFFTLKMSLEDFQLLDNEPFDNSIIKRDFTKTSH